MTLNKIEFLEKYKKDYIFKSIAKAKGYVVIQNNILKFGEDGSFQAICNKVVIDKNIL